MKYLLIMTILIGGFSAHAVGIPGLLELPSAPSAISESKILLPAEQIYSCRHHEMALEQRYEKLLLMKEAIDSQENIDAVNKMVDHLMEFSKSFVFDLGPDHLVTEFNAPLPEGIHPVEYKAKLGFVGHRMILDSGFGFLHDPVSFYTKDSKHFVKISLTAMDLCGRNELSLLFLSGCQSDVYSYLSCNPDFCPKNIVVDWQSCTRAQRVSIDLAPIRSRLGLRSSEIGGGSR